MQRRLFYNISILLILILFSVSCNTEKNSDITMPSDKTGSQEILIMPTEKATSVPLIIPQNTVYTETYSNKTTGIDLSVLVNRANKLASDYVPVGLEYMETVKSSENYSFNKNGMQANKDALIALDAMLEAANDDGIHDFLVVSGYRDYAYQQMLFNRKLEIDPDYGSDKTKPVSVAIPGSSEHQTGLSVDIVSRAHPELTQDFENTEHAKWLMNNCYRFGFILRYPKSCEDITIVMYEPWHYRYVGDKMATQIHDEGITFEEYMMDI